jgi:DNA-binding CsgD family transcriptional regulator
MQTTETETDSIGIAVVDEHCRYLYVNEQLSRYHGRKREEYRNRHISELIPPGPLLIVEPLYAYVLRSGLPATVEFYGVDPDDRCSAPVRWRASYVPAGKGVRASVSAQEASCAPYLHTFRSSALSATERAILELLAEGMSTKDVARQLNISTFTVATHRKHICKKLGVHSTSELIAVAIQETCPGSPTIRPMILNEERCATTP